MTEILRRDRVNEAIILFCGQKARVKCDRKCSKAWGRNSRPKQRLSEEDEDDYYYLADDELGDAPVDPGTDEGGHRKPTSPDDFPNKWCVREYERGAISSPGEWMKELELKSFEERRYSQPLKHQQGV